MAKPDSRGPAVAHPAPSCIDCDRAARCQEEEKDRVEGRDLFRKIEERFSFRKRILIFCRKTQRGCNMKIAFRFCME
jgi:hypothetical protein